MCLVVTVSARAQQPQPPSPHIGYVYPAGGKQGSTFQVVVGGQRLAGARGAIVSGTGITAKLVEHNRPMSPKEFNDLRDEIRTLMEKRRATLRRRSANATNVWTSTDEKRFAEIIARILKSAPNRQGTPAIAETVTLDITAAPDAEPGQREIRILTATGLSNPMLFNLDTLPEFAAPPAKAPNPELDRFRERFGLADKTPAAAKSETRVSLPVVLNGQILPGEVDRFRFTATKGQHLVATVSARELIPYLADAVPGWFQATLALSDGSGKELAYDDDFRFHPDPVLHFEIPRDGEYVLAIKDAIFRGREDFVYRITLGELPFITSLFPLGGRAGETTLVELKGWNLPTNSVVIETRNTDTVPVSLRKGPRASNALPFSVEDLPHVMEQEPNDSAEAASRVTLPVILNGRIDRPGDADVFQFTGRRGQEFVAEITARRLDSPLDSVLTLTDAHGQRLAFNDDLEDKGSGLNTHHADSYVRTTLSADGTYRVQIADTQRKGGADFAYRLRLSAPRPDFELRVVPSSVQVRAGASVPLTVYALRKDGFTNEITLALQDAPTGFKLTGALIPAGQDQARVTLIAPFAATASPSRLTLQGRARIGGTLVSHAAIPAEDMMQAFAYRHLVPAQELQVAVLKRVGFKPGRK